MLSKAVLNAKLRDFNRNFDSSREERATQIRGEFLRKFPLNRLKKLTIDDYVIGKGTPTFCAYVEAKTKPWANIQGATSSKFGIYFGRTSSDPRKKYRSTTKFGHNKAETFRTVKSALLKLVEAGQKKDFAKIDANPLSQMFKAKILSLYFPKAYLNVCSAENITSIASELGIPDCQYVSESQHRLVLEKYKNPITRRWSNTKFMIFLYDTYHPNGRGLPDIFIKKIANKKTAKKHPKVIFEDIKKNLEKIGMVSEKFALNWEKDRLIGLGHKNLVNQIVDRRDRPSYGYDFLSHSKPGHERYIEVKTAGKSWGDEGFRFFLSENQLKVSRGNKDYYLFLSGFLWR